MALPTLVKSYLFTYLNQPVLATGVLNTTVNKTIFAFTTAMKALSSNPWTEISSCDSTSVGTGKWVTYTNLIWSNGGAHSWIVLKQAGANNAQICIDLNGSTNANNVSVVYSPGAGFTGGSTTARPTATDQQVLLNQTSMFAGADANIVWHLLQSTDGQITRLLIMSGNIMYGFMAIDVPVIPGDLTMWTPLNSAVALGYNAQPTYANLSTAANTYCKINGVITALNWTSECFGGSPLPTTMTFSDDNTADWPLWPIGLYSASPPNRGHKGNLTDIWWGASINTIGSNYPQVGGGTSYQFAQFGGLVIPWNSSTAPLTA